MGLSLALTHNPTPAETSDFELVERVDYGVAVNAPTSILRFKPLQHNRSLWQILTLQNRQQAARFEAGDLFGVTPPMTIMPVSTRWPRQLRMGNWKSVYVSSSTVCVQAICTAYNRVIKSLALFSATPVFGPLAVLSQLF